ncbi:hypothetical protein SRB5_56820 [Streptomyces sp. RB5]|uniref:PPM-type phosphatase domain-containing protein n=1 Tax=Streptomyces smaragdinus TaxID=2585196 RepID=A0A7K0CPT1_9ACTN|nr:protein phosphatase 2C domain-containing protein [Streptomyces smaragdinus]MQY15500.1 hypothetical protein [Streptomyces smaragdinus]
MAQQGEAHEDNTGRDQGWWDELYEPGAADTGPPASGGDTIDDRFDSAVRTVAEEEDGAQEAPPLPPPDHSPQSTLRLRRDASDPTAGALAPDDPAPAPVTPRFEATPRPAPVHLDDRPPSHAPGPAALPPVTAAGLADLTPDTELDGATHGTMTLRCASARGDGARQRGEPRGDALLTARFGTGDSSLLLVAVATGARDGTPGRLAARDACLWLGGSVGRSHARLDQDIREGRRGSLKSGLHRLTGRMYGLMRAKAAELGHSPDEYTAGIRCLLLPADPACRIRVFFGTGPGGLFRLRDGDWQDIEPEPGGLEGGGPVVGFGSRPEEPAGRPQVPDPRAEPPASPPTLLDAAGQPVQPFSFRASVARPGDTLLLAGAGLAAPLRGEPALAATLAERWRETPPDLAAFLADLQLRVEGHTDDRSAAAVWER